MSDATDFLAASVAAAPAHAPSITVTSAQRHTGPSGSSSWAPGIVGFGWGINGRAVADAAGAKNSLAIGLMMWFSDRRSNPSETPPAWQQFAAGDADSVEITLSPVGEAVRAEVELLTWQSSFSADSFLFEPQSSQLLFVTPGAGPGAPPAIMTLSLHPTGEFGFL